MYFAGAPEYIAKAWVNPRRFRREAEILSIGGGGSEVMKDPASRQPGWPKAP